MGQLQTIAQDGGAKRCETCCRPCDGVPLNIIDAALDEVFPMSCITMDTFLNMDRMVSHGELNKMGLLVRPCSATCVHFVSHEWLSGSHPDPAAVHLRRLQQVFREMSEGNVKQFFSDRDWQMMVERPAAQHDSFAAALEPANFKKVSEHSLSMSVHSGLVWLDFCCIPQFVDYSALQHKHFLEEQKLAMHSLPFYVERSDFFWVLAPTAEHEDFRRDCSFHTWRSRGWCRLEEWANLLSSSSVPPLVVTEAPIITTYGTVAFALDNYNRLERAPCMGDFTCCSQLHYVKTGSQLTPIPCDKQVTVHVLREMFRARVRSKLVEAPVLGLALCGLERMLFAGVEIVGTPSLQRGGTEEFVGQVGLETSAACAGTDKLQAAVWCQQQAMVHKLVKRLCPGEPLPRNQCGLDAFDVCVLTGNVEAAEALLDSGIGVDLLHLPNKFGATPLQTAAGCGHRSLVQSLLVRRAAVNARNLSASPLAGWSALHYACVNCHDECCRLLLHHHAAVNASDAQGVTPLELVTAEKPMVIGNQQINARSETIRILLEAMTEEEVIATI